VRTEYGIITALYAVFSFEILNMANVGKISKKICA
jgi:hypothetical protein